MTYAGHEAFTRNTTSVKKLGGMRHFGGFMCRWEAAKVMRI
jgi:hypothetical protein